MRKKEPRLAKITISVLGFMLIGTLMFMLGRISNDDITATDQDKMVNYVIESGYQHTDIDFEKEAKYIKKHFKSPMSTSKIKHILIYINGMCEHYDLNYNLVKSVISTESHWNHKAKSSAGAVGLMQIMRACAKDYKTPHSEMYDPYVNVTIGIKYLAKLTNRFDNTQTALVGYNEGPRYAENYKVDYINNSRYVHKVMTHLLKFEPYIAGV